LHQTIFFISSNLPYYPKGKSTMDFRFLLRKKRVSPLLFVVLFLLILWCLSVLPDTLPAAAASHQMEFAEGHYRPETIDGEIGVDFRLSSMGQDGKDEFDAFNPALAYNSTDNQYLVVWEGSATTKDEFEIWGQLVNAANGAEIGGDFCISFMGADGDPDFDAFNPSVAYNSTDDQYLVVWSGDHGLDGEFEIWGQRLDDSPLLDAPFQISEMGPISSTLYGAFNPVVAYNSTENQYLVVWEADDDSGGLLDDEFEIWARRLTATGELIDADNQRISDMGGIGDADYDAHHPDLVYNSSDNQYMVVWEGDDTTAGMVNDEFEIWGQRLDAALGELSANDFRISETGDANHPAVAYNSTNNQYFVVWDTSGKFEIYGQRLSANGDKIGTKGFHLSDSGDGVNTNYDALNPAVLYESATNQYMVVWQDDELGAFDFEIWGQRLDAATGNMYGFDTRLSDMGAVSSKDYAAKTPAIVYSGESNNQYLIVWSGDDTTDDEFEIWGQRFAGSYNISVKIGGTGTGVVNFNPPGIDCDSGTCVQAVVENWTLALTATAGAGSDFKGWDSLGPCAGERSNVCVLPVTSIQSVTAIFNLKPKLTFLPLVIQ
jgi:hypothetical protein